MSQRLYLPGHPTPAIGGAVQPGFAAGGFGGGAGGGGALTDAWPWEA